MPNPSVLGPMLGLLLVLGIVGPAWAGLVYLFSRRPRTAWFWLFLVVYVAASAWWLASLVSPAKVYEDVFREPPSADVADLDYEIDRQNQAGALVMRFHAEAATVGRLCKARLLDAGTAGSPEPELPQGVRVPTWWTSRDPGAEAWHGTGRDASYEVLEEWLFHDAGTGQVHYVMIGRPRS